MSLKEGNNDRRQSMTVTESATVLRVRIPRDRLQRRWCSECSENVLFVRPDTTDKELGIGHALHITDGMICLRSLLADDEADQGEIYEVLSS